MLQNPKLVIIVGPTASGKTNLSIQLAQHLQTNILSFDSRQCYTELNIGVAKPTVEELNKTKHYFINSHSIYNPLSVNEFVQYAKQVISEHHNKEYLVLVGGTGLYINALIYGLNDIPEIDPEIRNKIRKNYTDYGIEYLQKQLIETDPIFAAKGEIKNPHRVMRALEVYVQTGKSILEWQNSKERNHIAHKTYWFGIDIEKDILHNRIEQRIDEMIKQGLEKEVFQLREYMNLQALQTVGYREWKEYFNGKFGIAEVVESIKTSTRQYAKRQITWFKKNNEIKWCKSEYIFEEIIKVIHQ